MEMLVKFKNEMYTIRLLVTLRLKWLYDWRIPLKWMTIKRLTTKS